MTEIINWQELIPLLNKGVVAIHGQNWPSVEMVIELSDESTIEIFPTLAISTWGIVGDFEIEYIPPSEEEEEKL